MSNPSQPHASLALLDAHALKARHIAGGQVALLPQSRRLRLFELGYEDIPRLSGLFAQTVPLTQNQFDALVSLTYNVGANGYPSCTQSSIEMITPARSACLADTSTLAAMCCRGW